MMITVTLKAHHWRIARRDRITLHCNNLVSSIILSLSLETRRSPEINSQNHKHSDPAQTEHRERQRELWSAAAAKPKKTERERIGKNEREGGNGGGGTYSICNWSEICFLFFFGLKEWDLFSFFVLLKILF